MAGGPGDCDDPEAVVGGATFDNADGVTEGDG